MSRLPGPLALAIALLALFQAILSALLTARIWTSGLAPPPDHPLAALQSLAYAGSALLTLIWMARAVVRVTGVGTPDLSAGPVMAVLWWFVPLANLVMPVKIMAELRRASINPADWQAVEGSPLIALWWAGCILSNVAGIALWQAESSPELDLTNVLPTLALINQGLTAATALLFLLLLLGIDRRLRLLAGPPLATPQAA